MARHQYKIKSGFFVFLIMWATLMMFLPGSTVATAEEKQTISVVYCNDCIPFQFQNQEGKPDGMIVDHWKLWSRKTGIKVDFAPASWDETLEMMRDGKVDAHAGLFFNEERDKYLEYGTALRKMDTHIFFDRQLPLPESNLDFKPYKIGVISGDYVEGYLKKNLPSAVIAGYDSYDKIIEAFRKREIKVFAADTPIALYHLAKTGLSGKIRYKPGMPLYRNDWFVAVKEGNSSLIKKINQGMNLISEKEKQKIARRWASAKRADDTEALIIAIDRGYFPFSFVGIDGEATGIFVEMWKLWGKATGTPIHFRPSSWVETLEAIRSGEADIHSGLSKNEERSKWIAFSKPIYQVDNASYFRAGKDRPVSLAGLKGEKIGAIQGSIQEDYLKTKYPDIKVVLLPDSESLILSLLKGETRAFIDELPVVDANLNRLGLTGALVRGSEILFSDQIYAGVWKDNETLLKKINKGFESIPVKQLKNLEARWIPREDDLYYNKMEARKNLNLDEEEMTFLRKTSTIKVHNEMDWVPFNFNREGIPKGFSIDYIKLLAKKTGLNIQFVHGPSWDEFLEMIKSGKLDVMLNIAKSPEREQYLEFTSPYVKMAQMLYTRSDFPQVNSIEDLFGKTFAVPKGFYLQDVLKKYPKIKVLEVENTIESIRAVSVGKADALFDLMPVVNYTLDQLQITNIKVGGELKIFDTKPIPLHIGVRKDLQILAKILEKGMSIISDKEIEDLQDKWLGKIDATKKELRLTNDERDWLKTHKAIRLGVDSSWPPFEKLGHDGAYEGIASDYVRLLNKQLAINMAPVMGLTWPEILDKVKKGDLDVIPCIARSSEREKIFLFTKPYLRFQSVITTRDDSTFVNGLRDLNGKRVGVVKGYITQEMIERDYPGIEIKPYSNMEEGLMALADRDVDAFVDNLASITYSINRMGLEKVRVASTTEYTFDLAFGVRKDWPELVGILDKALQIMSKEEKAQIHDRWINVHFERQTDWKMVGIIVILFVVVGGSILGFVITWNRKLSTEVSERKKMEETISSERTRLQGILDTSPIGVAISTNGTIRFANPRFMEIFGIDVGNETPELYVHQEERKKIVKILESEGRVENYELQMYNREHQVRDMLTTYLPITFHDEDGILVWIIDITDRKAAEKVIRESEERIKTILNSINTGIIVIDEKDRTIVDANPVAEKMIGLPKKDIIGNLCHKFICPREMDDCPIIDNGQTVDNADRILLNAEGQEVPILKTVVKVMLGGKPHLVESFIDLTERKAAEEELKGNLEELEQFSKLTINREERMIELKEEINQMFIDSGKPRKYKIVS